MQRLLAHATLMLSLTACGSDPLTPRGSNDGGIAGTDAGTAGEASQEGGAGGETNAGAAGAAAGDAGAAASDGAGGEAGASPVPVIGYRLAGIAHGSFAAGEGGASGASDASSAGEGGSMGGQFTETGAGGAAGAPVELPTIDRAECNFYLDFVDVVDDETGGFEAFAYGEVFRNVYSGEQRWEFSAFVAGLASFTVDDDGSAELRAFGDQTGAKPFWREIEVLHGTRNANGTSGGFWSCASLELFEPGFPDTSGTATGTWLLVPVN